MNWNLNPIAASSFWNFAMVLSSRCLRQLNDGEQLYANIWSGCSALTASENLRAISRSGVPVSIQIKSANGA